MIANHKGFLKRLLERLCLIPEISGAESLKLKIMLRDRTLVNCRDVREAAIDDQSARNRGVIDSVFRQKW